MTTSDWSMGDHVNRQFRAPCPNRLWLSDFTYVATWGGFVYVAFVIDAFARRIVGWLVHHSDRGVQYVSIKYTERLADAGIEPSVGSVGDSYDNALAETINGLYKAELIHRRGPWRSFEAVERGGRVCLNTVSLSISGSSAGLVGSMPASWPRARRA